MKKLVLKYSLIIYAFCFLPVLLSCGKMDTIYKDFTKDGTRIYTGVVDSVKVFSGYNRVKMTWQLSSDPNVSDVKIYWNNKTDSAEVNVSYPRTDNKMEVVINNLAQGNYSFVIVTFDKAGNKSLPVEVPGISFGDEYGLTLQNRIVKSALPKSGKLNMEWLPGPSNALTTEIYYTDLNDLTRNVKLGNAANGIVLEDFKSNTYVKYKTAYLPDNSSIDTFYSALDSIYVN